MNEVMKTQLRGTIMKQLRRENGEDEVMQYSCIEEQMKGNSYEAVERRDMVKMKLCSTLVQRNR